MVSREVELKTRQAILVNSWEIRRRTLLRLQKDLMLTTAIEKYNSHLTDKLYRTFDFVSHLQCKLCT